eukprot:4203562-Alexandrium_andersonii.AAC.1
MGAPTGTPTPWGPSQPNGLAPGPTDTPVESAANQGSTLLATPPGLMPPAAGPAAVEGGVEAEADDEEVVVVDQSRQ